MPSYSHSRLSEFEKCPLSYKISYIDGIKREEEGVEAFLGSRENLRPYMVFSDVSLKDMATKRPQNHDSFRNIYGVGEVKRRKYGNIFINTIIEYCDEKRSKSDANAENIKEDNITKQVFSIEEINKVYPTL